MGMEQTEEQVSKKESSGQHVRRTANEGEQQQKPETTMRVYKRDAIILKQMQDTLGLQNRAVTQAEIMHQMLNSLFEHRQSFFHEMERMERQHRENQKMMEQWMRFMMKKMNNI